MDLRSGTRLGPYEIQAPIGAGGMGEVYRARDERLGRIVAIKILPAEFANDAKLKIRFDREAKAISALNHPHICSLFDVRQEGSTRFLVMEYCDGGTLADRIRRGPLPLDDVLKHGSEIADALARAHKDGIVHRDLKPSNVVLTKSGVKLVDFGLAIHREASPGEDSTSTFVRDVSEEGQIVGTLAYMAPEVLEAGGADARSDIYGLGLLLYEMLTGRQPFQANSRAMMIAAILEHAPAPPSQARHDVNPQLDHVVDRCLRKDPDERWQTAADVLIELQWLQKARSDQTPRTTRNLPRRLVWGGVIAGVIAIAAFQMTRTLNHHPQVAPARTAVSLIVSEPPITLKDGYPNVAIAPDGKTIAYVAGDQQSIFVHKSGELTDTAMAGTEKGTLPFFSPDGLWIGFATPAYLKKVAVTGGLPQNICQIPPFISGATWGGDGNIVYATRGSLYAVSSNGGRPVRLLQGDGSTRYAWPSFIPGKNEVLLTVADRRDRNDSLIARFDLTTRRLTPVIRGGNQAHYSTTGHLLFARTAAANVRSATIYSVPYDLKEAIRSAANPVATDIKAYPVRGTAYWDVSQNGTVVYVPHDPHELERELVWIDKHGLLTPACDRLMFYGRVKVFPDGRRVATHDFNAVWVGDLTRDVWQRISEEALWVQSLVLSPDGTRIAYVSETDTGYSLYAGPADGGTRPEIIETRKEFGLLPNSWSPDGKHILLDGGAPASGRLDIWILDVKQRQASPLITESSGQHGAFISPDGKWIAYTSHERTGPEQINVRAFPNGTTRHVIYYGIPSPTTRSFGPEPRWSRDGREILFDLGNKMMAVDISTSPTFRAGTPHVLFETSDLVLLDTFDIAPDGRFLAVKLKRKPAWDHLNVVSGWWSDP